MHLVTDYILVNSDSFNLNKYIENPYVFDGVTFAICIDGEINVTVNYKTYKIQKGQVFTILPDNIAQIVYKSYDFSAIAFLAIWDFMVKLPIKTEYDKLLFIRENPCIFIDENELENIIELYNLIVKHHHNNKDNVYHERFTELLLSSFILKVASLYADNKVRYKTDMQLTRQEELTDKFFILLFKYFKNERTVSFYADKLCLTPKYLSMMVKNVTGRTISEWICQAVIIDAKKQLKRTNMTVLQVSEELNFSNPSFFGRFFKQHTGVTPMQYKSS